MQGRTELFSYWNQWKNYSFSDGGTTSLTSLLWKLLVQKEILQELEILIWLAFLMREMEMEWKTGVKKSWWARAWGCWSARLISVSCLSHASETIPGLGLWPHGCSGAPAFRMKYRKYLPRPNNMKILNAERDRLLGIALQCNHRRYYSNSAFWTF